MVLTLSIQNADRLENGSPLSLVLDSCGATIGRAMSADWSLPDTTLTISSRHCEVRFDDGRYELVDHSTNGTFLLGQNARLPGAHAIAPGDVFVIGPFHIQAALGDAAGQQAMAQEMWGRFDASNVVDWARGGFGEPAQPAEPPPPETPPPAEPAAGSRGHAFASAIGIPPERLRAGEDRTLARAGRLLRQLVGGLVVMLEARNRAKSQLGAEATSIELNGNNPLKFALTPERALEQLLNAPERGFMDGEPAIEDAFRDLQAHQVATLRAMQGALRTTLDRFSPNAIRSRTETSGVLARIVPGARDAALWAAYEREFSGVAKGSDEAFMAIFAREFRRAYEEAVHQR